jgi:hypothetical protein
MQPGPPVYLCGIRTSHMDFTDEANNEPNTLVSPSKRYLLVHWILAEWANPAATGRLCIATHTDVIVEYIIELSASCVVTASSPECKSIAMSCTTTATTRHAMSGLGRSGYVARRSLHLLLHEASIGAGRHTLCTILAIDGRQSRHGSDGDGDGDGSTGKHHCGGRRCG